jgi:hypothetical protein
VIFLITFATALVMHRTVSRCKGNSLFCNWKFILHYFAKKLHYHKNMTISDRLIIFINEVSIEDILSKTSTLKQSNLYRIRKGGNCSGEVLDEIFKIYPNLSAEWILRGTGTIWINSNLMENSENRSSTIEGATEKELLQKIITDKDSHITDLRRTIALLEKSLMGK